MRKLKRGNLTPHPSSIILNLKPILMARSITFPVAYLIKLGINNTSAIKILKGEAVQINFRQLTALCMNLNCTPNDLFSLRDMTLPDHHQLHALRKVEDAMVNPLTVFEGKSLKEIREFAKGLVGG